jgi:3-methyladenine DNA glycosylase AlkD
MTITGEGVIASLRARANPAGIAGMAHFGSRPAQALGLTMPALRQMAREIGRNHPLALELWDSGLHEGRILASLLADPKQVTPELMEDWIKDFDAWDVCDQVCGNLFDKTPYAYQKAIQWCQREPEYVRRAGFTMIAVLAVHDKKAPDETFLPFFPLIKQYSGDERNFVKKAVNWALRQIGKRNSHLRGLAIEWAGEIRQTNTKAGRWIANDAIRELQGKAASEKEKPN